MESSPPPPPPPPFVPEKVYLSSDDKSNLPRDELIKKWDQMQSYLKYLETQFGDSSKPLDERIKLQQQESSRRENVLLMRMATKEQEMLSLLAQNQELKQAQTPSANQLQSMLIDPAVNLLFEKMKTELTDTKEKLDQAQNDLNAWKFTPDSVTGKRLMAKCRMLLQENQELGKQLSQGRIAQLEAELSLQKKYSEELKSSQDEMSEFVIQLDQDMEGMEATICALQQQLKDLKATNEKMTTEIEQLKKVAEKQIAEKNDAESERDHLESEVKKLVAANEAFSVENQRLEIENDRLNQILSEIQTSQNGCLSARQEDSDVIARTMIETVEHIENLSTTHERTQGEELSQHERTQQEENRTEEEFQAHREEMRTQHAVDQQMDVDIEEIEIKTEPETNGHSPVIESPLSPHSELNQHDTLQKGIPKTSFSINDLLSTRSDISDEAKMLLALSVKRDDTTIDPLNGKIDDSAI